MASFMTMFHMMKNAGIDSDENSANALGHYHLHGTKIIFMMHIRYVDY